MSEYKITDEDRTRVDGSRLAEDIGIGFVVEFPVRQFLTETV